jgi:hypothetical protein
VYVSQPVFGVIYFISSTRMSVRSQLETECQKEFNNKINISTKSVKDNDIKALIID